MLYCEMQVNYYGDVMREWTRQLHEMAKLHKHEMCNADILEMERRITKGSTGARKGIAK
jgi:hypothetical protein